MDPWLTAGVKRFYRARGAHQHLASLLAQCVCLDQYARAVVRRCPRILRGVHLDELALVDLVEACKENWVLAFCKPADHTHGQPVSRRRVCSSELAAIYYGRTT